MPFFSRAEMDKFVALTGKSLGCAGKKSVPTGLKKATTFLKDEYLKAGVHVNLSEILVSLKRG